MKTKSTPNPGPADTSETAVRGRILEAAFSAFLEYGYAETTTLEIATRAKVSKRELYALVGTKHESLVACITERAMRFRIPADMPVARDRATLEQVLENFGVQLLREVSDPHVVALFRLAIAEVDRAPEVARALDGIGREAGRTALRQILVQARSSGLIDGNPTEIAAHFVALLWGELMLNLLLRLADSPKAREMKLRAHNAAAAIMRLYASPDTG